jgi:hypothetical protein
MSKEQWATYSVIDHLRPRDLAIDLMLFDRLVFPVPEAGAFAANSGSPIERGPVEWTPNPTEWTRWEKSGWDPAAQSKLLDILSPVIRKVPWSSKGKMNTEYRAEAARLAAEGVPDYAFSATRTLLTKDLPAHVEGVAALGPAYRTFEEFERECGNRNEGTAKLPQRVLANVLAAKFIVPDINDQQLSNEELLTETVNFVTGNTEFREHRAAFIEWQQSFIRDNKTDKESIGRAIEKMNKLLEQTNSATRKLEVRKVVRYLFRLAPSIVGLGGAISGHGAAFAVGGFYLSLGAIAVEEKLFKSAEQSQSPATAFVHDARRHFGWKD